MQLDDDKIQYFQRVTQSDFYSNDKEFISIIKKLTQQSASLNNKAISLVSLLNEAEQIKLAMVEKEIELGLSQKNKPYGKSFIELIKDESLIYKNHNVKMKPYIEKFIYVLEHYLENEDPQIKKSMLQEAKATMDILKQNNIEPMHFIITPERSKVWYILDKAYSSTIKKFNIDFFIQKIKNTKLQHLEAVDDIKEYNKQKQQAIFDLADARKNNASQEVIQTLQKKLEKELSTDVAPLLIDTHKIMNSLDFMLEDIPDALNAQQTQELKEFLPVLSEYYIDQTYAISGGNSFTNLAKNLSYLQQIIDQDAPASVILKEVNKLEYTMQHLYILHWIGESLLKDILHCYHHQCSIGVTIRRYKDKYTQTKSKFNAIQKAIYFRNEIAHNGVIWSPEKIKTSIEAYKEYITTVALERDIKLDQFHLPKIDRELSQEQKEKRVENFLSENFNVKKDDIDSNTVLQLTKELEEHHWKLSKDALKRFKKKIDFDRKENFCQENFDISYKEAKEYFLKYAQKNFEIKEGDNLEEKAIKTFTWTYYNKDIKDNAQNVQKNIIELRKRIEAVSDKKYSDEQQKSKGGLFGWLS